MSSRLQLVLTCAIAWCVCRSAGATAPLMADDPPRIESTNRKFFAIPAAGATGTMVFRGGDGAPQLLWKMNSWPHLAWLSDDGEYMVVGYPGSNLLDGGSTPDQEMITFLHRGKQVAVVRARDLFVDPAFVHWRPAPYSWGAFVGFIAPKQFAVDTAEKRRLVFDVSTGRNIVAAATRTDDPPRRSNRNRGSIRREPSSSRDH